MFCYELESMFDNPQMNQEYILSLRPHLVYYVTQLWQEIELLRGDCNRDEKQFVYYWEEIIKYCKAGSIIRKRYNRWSKIEETNRKWEELIKSYKTG